MFRALVLAALAVVSVTLFGDPRPSIARAHQADAGSPPVAAIAASPTTPPSDLLELPITDAPAAAEPVAVEVPAAEPVAAAAVETPVAPDTSVAAAQPVQAAAVVTAPAPVVVAAPPPAACPSTWLCYPRVGIAGPIVPYNDCSAGTDVGTAIRAITCVSPTYFAAHAYTQFGRITGWQAGDIVFAYGVRYVLYSGFTQGSCVTPIRAIAALSLQTSLSTNNCGPVLVLQGRPG